MKAFRRDQCGATSIERGMIGALVFLVIVTSVTAFGNKTTEITDRVTALISAALP